MDKPSSFNTASPDGKALFSCSQYFPSAETLTLQTPRSCPGWQEEEEGGREGQGQPKKKGRGSLKARPHGAAMLPGLGASTPRAVLQRGALPAPRGAQARLLAAEGLG